MKRIVTLSLAVLLLLLLGACSGSNEAVPAAEDYIIRWTDPSMEAVIRRYLDREDDKGIHASELSQIQIVVIREHFVQFNNETVVRLEELAPISRLDDLEHFARLGGLTLYDTSISDLSALGRLTRLRQLMLYDNQNITDIVGIENLQEITLLVLHGNGIRDYSPILKLENLVELDLQRRHREPLDMAGAFPKLRILTTDLSSEADLDNLAQLPNLIELNLQKCGISDLTPLAGLDNLSKLRLGSNRITDLGPLSGLERLSLLDVSANQLTTLEGVETLTNLVRLDITRNQISDLSPLAELQKLTQLDAGRNTITDISPLSGLRQLRTLNLQDNQISNLVPLEKRSSLVRLDISNNPVSEEAVQALQQKRKNCEITT